VPSTQTRVIVGAGMAGAKAAEALRDEGFEGSIALIGQELDQPCERPPLSKDYLRGESPREKAFVHPGGFYAEQGIELRTSTTVDRIASEAREVVLDDSERLGYDRLLLATGAEPRRLSISGADLDGVHYLRDLRDADRLAARLRPGARAVVIGGGGRRRRERERLGRRRADRSADPLAPPGRRRRPARPRRAPRAPHRAARERTGRSAGQD
jgi:3-phenylpropionate/trans-cinnamate dioxygenase ferredoxin reductase component